MSTLREIWHSCQPEGSGVRVDQNSSILLPVILLVADAGVEERSHKRAQWGSQKSNDIGEDGCRARFVTRHCACLWMGLEANSDCLEVG